MKARLEAEIDEQAELRACPPSSSPKRQRTPRSAAIFERQISRAAGAPALEARRRKRRCCARRSRASRRASAATRRRRIDPAASCALRRGAEGQAGLAGAAARRARPRSWPCSAPRPRLTGELGELTARMADAKRAYRARRAADRAAALRRDAEGDRGVARDRDGARRRAGADRARPRTWSTASRCARPCAASSSSCTSTRPAASSARAPSSSSCCRSTTSSSSRRASIRARSGTSSAARTRWCGCPPSTSA